MSIQAGTRVGQIATALPLATRVFARHGIDFCCGGGKTLEEACKIRGLEAEEILGEIEQEHLALDDPSKDESRSWEQAPLAELIDHILSNYHEPLAEELPRLEGMARKVAGVHGDRDPEMFKGLLTTFLDLKAELEEHMMKEEQVLFPLIRHGKGSMTAVPIDMMEADHESAGASLARLRELADDYRVPEDACNTWRALWHGLAELEGSLHRHIHLENNILFPRALAS
ncbi:MAG: iron-sulfur cluster repair di-iron protein [Deltaproteobacteria bacterium]|nr:iron-sulfur cluster repair di-iron protein [Deltaproteobacteria bacterium]